MHTLAHQSRTKVLDAALQGAFILAKAQGSVTIVAQCIDHLRQHVANLLGANPGPVFYISKEPTP